MSTPSIEYEMQSLAKKRRIKGMVYVVLRDEEKARNSDSFLTAEIWKRFYKDKFIRDEKSDILYMQVDMIKDLPSQDSIKRTRAQFQNNMQMFLPTDPMVAKKRGWEENMWKIALGYSV